MKAGATTRRNGVPRAIATHVIRIQWGYWMLYGNYGVQHADHSWDGTLAARDGEILRCWLLEFSGYAGPGRESLLPLPEPRWHWQPANANNRMGGVVFELRGGADSLVSFCTRTIDFSFSVEQLAAQKVLRFHVGPRYSNVDVTVTLDGYDPELDHASDLAALTRGDGRFRALLEAGAMRAPLRRWFRTDWSWVMPRAAVQLEIPAPRWGLAKFAGERFLSVTIRCAAAFPVRPGETLEEIVARGGARNVAVPADVRSEITLPWEALFRGELIARGRQFFAYLGNVPLMEELTVALPERRFESGPGTLIICNGDDQAHLLIARAYLEEQASAELSIRCPRWVRRGAEFEAIVTCRAEQRSARIRAPESVRVLTPLPTRLPAGEHRAKLRIDHPLADVSIAVATDSARGESRIEQVVAVEPEAHPMLVGLEDKTLPANSPGHREDVIRHMATTQMADLLIFRRGRDVESTAQLAALCRAHGIYCRCTQPMGFDRLHAMQRAAGPFLLGWEWTEHDGPLWGYIQTPLPSRQPVAKATMRTAYEAYLEYIRSLVARVRRAAPDTKVWLMVSAIGHSLAYAGGMDVCVSQLNKSHNVALLSDARGAARAHGRELWGSYQAEGAHVNPDGPQQLRMWWLSLYLAYAAGAATANDEECLYRTWHERLYARGDRVPRERRRILREFNRYVKTHPRRGAVRVRQALLIGRYACDVADGIGAADAHGTTAQTMVWRNFGEWTPAWRPSQAEYGMRHLDVFLPGVWLQTLLQSPGDVRRWYSGTPYGEIDFIPVDCDPGVLGEYALLFMLGWNTADDAQYDRLKSYVEGGGKLFLSVPHLTRNEEREFLWNGLEPLNLIRDGDYADLFGVRVAGRGAALGNVVAEGGTRDNPLVGYAQSASFFRLPPVPPLHDRACLAEVTLAGAEVLARDAQTGKPVLVRRRLGKGEAYLLCTWAYPGSSWLKPLVNHFLRALGETVPAQVALEDGTGDVYYTVRVETARSLRGPEDDENRGTGMVRQPSLSGQTPDQDQGVAPDHLVHRIHLLNTDWTAAGNEKACRLRLGGNRVDVRIREGRLSEIVWAGPLVFLVEDPNVHVAGMERTAGGYTAPVHGHGRAEIALRALGKHRIGAVTWRGRPVSLEPEAGWTRARFDFAGRSTGDLAVEVLGP